MEIRDLSDNLCAMLSEAAPGVMELLIQKVQREWFYLFFPRCPISNSVKESACLESEMFWTLENWNALADWLAVLAGSPTRPARKQLRLSTGEFQNACKVWKL